MTATNPTLSGTTQPQASAAAPRQARAVLLDFAGPVCDLFAGRSTRPVAMEIKAMSRKKRNSLDPAVEACDDSQGILHFLRDMLDRRADVILDPTALSTANEPRRMKPGAPGHRAGGRTRGPGASGLALVGRPPLILLVVQA
ncbi:hypothetical protein PV729_20180 [Streptomyces europaeiscabiei]|uniref:Transposase n=1 Tax=Streptomyces europaeiscabiei TaxID=146819 RepID=A0ABU4NGA8_9ACTN|nr:hypothetical protein [Streptomyces europaeiscabiei]MDX3544715.1 hypothetical protein [Streptomyces europaeiscabiei]MDX3554065.1 hypothetical protein [Streptomyces europaeiscabiei]MDX3702183.1 hypothetical protein [Streptomyces europaeiscabiei]